MSTSANSVFTKGLSESFLTSLETLSQKGTWWTDVLVDKTLIIAIRNEYLNVYWKGQSLFKVGYKGGKISTTTHPKYLIDPGLAEQISFTGDSFAIRELVEKAFIGTYSGKETLAKMKRAAGLYAGAEKEGVHAIVCRSPNVVDVEIALSKAGLDEAQIQAEGPVSVPRIDIAAFEEQPGGAELVFWEAKLFLNKELRAKELSAPVVKQIAGYQSLLNHHRDSVIESYKRVAQCIQRIASMSGGNRAVPGIVADIAGIKNLKMADPPKVGLLVFDFDLAQRDGTNWQKHRRKLEEKEIRIKAAGDANNIRL